MAIMPGFGLAILSHFFAADHENKMTEKADQVLQKFVAQLVPLDIKVQHIVAYGTIYKTII